MSHLKNGASASVCVLFWAVRLWLHAAVFSNLISAADCTVKAVIRWPPTWIVHAAYHGLQATKWAMEKPSVLLAFIKMGVKKFDWFDLIRLRSISCLVSMTPITLWKVNVIFRLATAKDRRFGEGHTMCIVAPRQTAPCLRYKENPQRKTNCWKGIKRWTLDSGW